MEWIRGVCSLGGPCCAAIPIKTCHCFCCSAAPRSTASRRAPFLGRSLRQQPVTRRSNTRRPAAYRLCPLFFAGYLPNEGISVRALPVAGIGLLRDAESTPRPRDSITSSSFSLPRNTVEAPVTCRHLPDESAVHGLAQSHRYQTNREAPIQLPRLLRHQQLPRLSRPIRRQSRHRLLLGEMADGATPHGKSPFRLCSSPRNRRRLHMLPPAIRQRMTSHTSFLLPTNSMAKWMGSSSTPCPAHIGRGIPAVINVLIATVACSTSTSLQVV